MTMTIVDGVIIHEPASVVNILNDCSYCFNGYHWFEATMERICVCMILLMLQAVNCLLGRTY